MTKPALTCLEPPYYAVIFTSLRTDADDGYAHMAQRMLDLASQQPGFLGFESARDEIGLSISYWSDLKAIESWKHHAEHREAQAGADRWYEDFRVRICRVEREYGGDPRQRAAPDSPAA